MSYQVGIVGGGAAGHFFASQFNPCRWKSCSENPNIALTLVEGTPRVLQKVRISGGGRCNLTHYEFDIDRLTACYPRGSKMLRSLFHKFQPADTITWFAERGLATEAEADGRVFPTTHSSESVIEILQNEAASARCQVIKGSPCFQAWKDESGRFWLRTKKNHELGPFDALLLATGSSPTGHKIAQSFGHSLTPLAPSLFTFQAEPGYWQPFAALSGVSFPSARTSLQLMGKRFVYDGPLLLTHWGVSGPALLKLSAYAARELQEADYHCDLSISFFPNQTADEVFQKLLTLKAEQHRQKMSNTTYHPLARRLWLALLLHSGIALEKRIHEVSHQQLRHLSQNLTNWKIPITSRGTYKDEFVTCGGVDLAEVNQKTMESRLAPGLFFAGEILDVDGITGGFNFQNAWTNAWIAAEEIKERCLRTREKMSKS